jgi:site-specific recombinase XerC
MAEKLIWRGKAWYYRLTMADGRRVTRKGCTDKRATEQMAAAAAIEQAKIKAGLIDPKDLAARQHEARPLADHVEDWYKDMVARRKTADHADRYRDGAGKVIALAMGRSLSELIPGHRGAALKRARRLLANTLARAHFSDLTPERIQQALAAILDGGRSAQTANHYRAAIRAFLRWCFGKGRIRDMPWHGVEAYNVEEDLRHIRRSLTDDELARLIAYAETAPDRLGMPGPLRAMAYRVAAATGFRAEELRSLTPQSFRLEGVRPTIYLEASCTKNRRPADQPIARSVAEILRLWLRGKPPGESVFPLHHDTGKAIRADLEAIGIAYETEDGVADFHSLRAYYVSALIRSGRSIKEVQQLARHSKPETTLKHYAKLTINDLHWAVESLPDLASPSPRPVALAATGTAGRPGPTGGTEPIHQEALAPSLRHSGDSPGLELASPDVMTLSNALGSMRAEAPEKRPSDASGRVQASPVSVDQGEGRADAGSPARRFSIPVIRREPSESSLVDERYRHSAGPRGGRSPGASRASVPHPCG